MMHQCQMLFLVTGQCNMACPHCAQGAWRKDHMEYHMTPDEVVAICRRVRELGMHFAQALIMGGELALWKHLEAGCRIIRESGVFDHIYIYSNCKKPGPVINVLDLGLADVVAVQSVNMSTTGILEFWKAHAHQVAISQQEGHRIHPDQPIQNSLPALCGCDQITVFNGKVWSCPGAYHNTVRLGWDVNNPQLWMNVEDDWRTYFERMDRYRIPACTVCLANGRVWDQSPIGSRKEDLV